MFLPETLCGRDAAAEPTGMYLRRVSGRDTRLPSTPINVNSYSVTRSGEPDFGGHSPPYKTNRRLAAGASGRQVEH